MKRIILVISLICIAALMGGLYGALYDQFTYSISNEFFTKMRFAHNHIEGDINNRWEVAKIGFQNTWSEGMLLGIFLSLAGLLHQDNNRMVRYTIQSFIIAILFGIIFGILAFLFVDGSSEVNNEITVNILDKNSYHKVELMNNYSHVGGIIGMFIGLGWQVFQTRKLSK